ncbi:MAG TPA: formyltransferase family protein [Candidatus Tectomicrobia bacterium]|nr:formyltransferase family protein [Candidatus Tectomicrobia bacterium]
MAERLRIGWFATGRGEGSRNLLRAAVDAIRDGRLNAEIAFVFCNRDPGEFEPTDVFLEQARSYGIPVITLSSRKFRRAHDGARARPGEPLPEWRHAYDRAVASMLPPFDIGMLAGYMLIATEELCERFPLLNLHPAAPGGPAGTWQEVIWQLIAEGATFSGVRIHLATTELDAGPVVTYCTYSLRGPGIDELWRDVECRTVEEARAEKGEDLPLFKEIRRRGAARELPLVVETLRAFADGRLRIVERRPYRDSEPIEGGLDLTPEVEAALGEMR